MKIGQKFTTTFLFIGILPMLIVSILVYISTSSVLRTRTADQLSSTAVKQEQRISSILQVNQEEVIKLANRYDLQTTLSQYVASPSDKTKSDITTILQSKKIETPTIQSAYIADTTGKVIASTRIDGPTQLPRNDLPNPHTNETVTSVRKDSNDGLSKLFIVTPVAVNKKDVAVLGVVFRTDDIVAAIQDYTGLGQTGETVVVAHDNVSLFPLRFNTDAALAANLDSLALHKTSSKAYREVRDYRNKDVLVVSRQIGLTDWVLATKIDSDEALAPVNELRTAMTGLVLVALVLIIVAALFFTRRFTQPIIQIEKVAQKIGQGDFTAQAMIERQDEIGSLAQSVNRMGGDLRQLISNTEEQRRGLEIILNSATEGIFAIDRRAVVIIANKAVGSLVQTNPAELVGQDMASIFSFTQGKKPITIDYSIPGVKTYTNLRYQDRSGSERFIKLIVAHVNDKEETGEVYAIVTIHDETKSRELETMKIDFVSMAAHELRTPLTAVRGYLELMSYKNQSGDEEIASYVQKALKNVTDLGGLVNNLLDVTRIERGTLTLHMEQVNIASEITQVIDSLHFIAQDKAISLTSNVPEENCIILADQVAFREIIINLVTNAIKYTNSGGKVTVSLKVNENHQYEIRVQDDGIGIPHAALSHVFDKFYRVHGGLDSGSSGTGLGLFIAKSIVERHHGDIRVESQEGVGSTFTVTIPMYVDRGFPQNNENENNVRRNRGWVTKNITR